MSLLLLLESAAGSLVVECHATDWPGGTYDVGDLVLLRAAFTTRRLAFSERLTSSARAASRAGSA